MKDVVQIVHLPSVVQSELYKATRKHFVRKENLNNDIYSTIRLHLFNNSQSSTPFSVISNARILIVHLFPIWFEWKQRVHALLMTENNVCTLHPSNALQNGTTLTHREREETNCWINVIIFIFFAYKKYYRCFIKFKLNHWWQMDYFDNVFHTFLDLNNVIYLVVNGTVTSAYYLNKMLTFVSL